MNIINFPTETIKKWDKQVRNLMAYKLKENQYIDCSHWYLPNYKAGYNLFKLINLQRICLPTNFLNYSANGKDVNTILITKKIIKKSNTKKQINNLLDKYKLKMAQNPTKRKEYEECNPTHFLKNTNSYIKLIEENINDIREIIKENKLINLEELNNISKKEWSKKEYKTLKNEMCKNLEYDIKDYILKRININEWKIDLDKLSYDEELQGYEIFIDESLKNEKAGYGIYYCKQHEYNYYDRVDGEQTLSNATLQGILHVLKNFPLNLPIIFGIDRKAVIEVVNNLPKSIKEQQNTLHIDTIRQIIEILEKRTAKIILQHIYSHTTETNTNTNKNQENNNKIDKMMEKYGLERTIRYIEGNKGADYLSDKAIDLPDIPRKICNKYQNEYILLSTRKKKTKIPHPNIIHTRIRKEIKKEIRTQESNELMKKPKYKSLEKYKNQISKYSYEIIKSKKGNTEPERKMMIRLIHESLPTCEKMNRLINKEGKHENQDFYFNKYGKVENNGYCPCCNEYKETVQHLFVECEDETIVCHRKGIHHAINSIMKKYFDNKTYHNIPKFYHDNNNRTEDSETKWNKVLGNYGLIPKEIENWIKNELNKDEKHLTKNIITEITAAIINTNIDIWKYRCKKLYTTMSQQNHPT